MTRYSAAHVVCPNCKGKREIPYTGGADDGPYELPCPLCIKDGDRAGWACADYTDPTGRLAMPLAPAVVEWLRDTGSSCLDGLVDCRLLGCESCPLCDELATEGHAEALAREQEAKRLSDWGAMVARVFADEEAA